MTRAPRGYHPAAPLRASGPVTQHARPHVTGTSRSVVEVCLLSPRPVLRTSTLNSPVIAAAQLRSSSSTLGWIQTIAASHFRPRSGGAEGRRRPAAAGRLRARGLTTPSGWTRAARPGIGQLTEGAPGGATRKPVGIGPARTAGARPVRRGHLTDWRRAPPNRPSRCPSREAEGRSRRHGRSGETSCRLHPSSRRGSGHPRGRT
jgi:hypothetical protein